MLIKELHNHQILLYLFGQVFRALKQLLHLKVININSIIFFIYCKINKNY